MASLQTVQVDSSAPSGAAITSGAPGMPTSDPRLTRSIADVLTSSGSSATPVINRADARFSAGCMVSPMRTYNAPDSRATTIAALPTSPRGCRNARTAHTATAMAARTHPAASESDCARSGSSTMRTSPRTSAFSIRRTRKRYPLTCSLVVDCPAIPSPAVSLTERRRWLRHRFQRQRARSHKSAPTGVQLTQSLPPVAPSSGGWSSHEVHNCTYCVGCWTVAAPLPGDRICVILRAVAIQVTTMSR